MSQNSPPETEPNPRNRRSRLRLFGLAIAAFFIVLATSQTSPYKRLDARVSDAQRSAIAEDADFSDLLIVDVDEASMQALESQIGAWPYEREVYALVGEHLARLGARLVVYDILFSEERGQSGDLRLQEVLSRNDNMILAGATIAGGGSSTGFIRESLETAAWPVVGYTGKYSNSALLPVPRFANVAKTGIITVDPDPDGILRRVPIALGIGNAVVPGLPLLAHVHPVGDRVLEFDQEAREVRLGDEAWPVDDDQLVSIEVPRNAGDLPVYSFYHVLLSELGAEEYLIPESEIRGKTVFIGSSAAILGDYVQLSGHGRMAGLGMLAIAYHALAHGKVYHAPPVLLALAIFALTALPVFSFPSAVRRNVAVGLALIALGLVLAVSAQWILITTMKIQVSLLTIVALSTALVAGVVAQRMLANARMQMRLEATAIAAKEAAAMKERFLAQMTHELRTPLTAIIGYNKMMLDSDVPWRERERHRGIISRSANHLMGLINNLLDQSKIEAGQLTLDVRPVNVRQATSEAIELLQGVADQKRLKLAAAFADEVPPYLELDELRVRQILINLLGNALKFTQKGGVTVSCNWHDDEMRLVVRDTGPGIPPEVLAKLFVPFEQGSARVAAEHGGTGLGLSISRNLAELMGGTLTAESAPGHGAEFILVVPAKKAAPPAEEVSRSTSALKGKVVLADDNPDNRNLFLLYLKSAGATVVPAENGVQAITEVRNERPDVVLMDMEMPEMDGLEASRKLRSEGFKGPILALTAHTDPNEHGAALSAGCTGVLVKPISKEQLVDALAEYLSHRPV